MAGRILNRRELRKQSDEAEAREAQQEVREDDEEADEDEAGEDEADDAGEEAGADAQDGDDDEEAKPAKKAKAKPKAAPKAAQAAQGQGAAADAGALGVFDAAMKQVAIFDYNQRPAAEEKAVELRAKKNGTFFLQMVKEPMPDEAPAAAAQ